MKASCSAALCGLFLLIGGQAFAQSSKVELEDLTWQEVRAAIKAGSTTVIVPAGGTEQNGPHMTLGKHNGRAKVLTAKIAGRLGNALVAPVMAYVPEGNMTPPQAHMRFTGTLSITPEAFMAVLDGTARSLKQHGFTDIVLVGDHGSYQGQLKTVATKLNAEWNDTKVRVHFIDAYYRTAQSAYGDALKVKGLTDAQIGLHAGTADTALTMATNPNAVKPDRFEEAARGGLAVGVNGDPQPSTIALGQIGVDLIVTRTVDAIKAVVKANAARR